MNTNRNTSEGATVLLVLMFALSLVAGVGFCVFSLEKTRREPAPPEVRQTDSGHLRRQTELGRERELSSAVSLEDGTLLARGAEASPSQSNQH